MVFQNPSAGARVRTKIGPSEMYYYLLALAALVIYLPRFLEWRSHFSRFHRLLNYLPGPAPIPIFGNAWEYITVSQHKVYDVLKECNKQYKPFFRLWLGPFMGIIHVTSFKYAEEIFNSTIHIEKSAPYRLLHSWLGTGLLTSTGPKWHSRRKLLTPAFHRSILESFQEVFEEKSEVLVKKLARMCNEGQVFNIEPYIAQSSLDVICETAMGTKMRIQEEVTLEEAKYLDAKNSAAEITTYRFLRPWLHPDFIFNMTPKGWKFNQSVKIMHDFTNKVIRTKREEYLKRNATEVNANYEDDAEVRPKKRKAFMDILIEASYADGPENKPFLSDLDIREEVDTFMFEGHDTTASSISWTLYLLGRHPEIQERVWQEVDEVFGDERISSMQKLAELRLLDRCIRESLRLYPSVPLIARKLREDIKLGDYIAPAGSEVFIHLILAHRDPDIFPEPDKFDPDNFLPENCEKRPPFAFVPFSAGSRNCIGQKFALQEMKTVLATILRNYRLESTDAPENLTVIPELVLRSKEGINVLLHPRK